MEATTKHTVPGTREGPFEPQEALWMLIITHLHALRNNYFNIASREASAQRRLVMASATRHKARGQTDGNKQKLLKSC